MGAILFERLRQLELPPDGYAIFGSGPLVIRGIIPLSNDLDIICRRDTWGEVSQIGTVEFLPEYNVTVATLSDGALTFGTEWGIGSFDIDELIATSDHIEGLPFVRIEHVVCYKKIRSSDKDRMHLDALQESDYSF